MLITLLTTTGALSNINLMMNSKNKNFVIIEHTKWKEFQTLLLSNDKLMKEFIGALFSFHIHAFYVEALCMMADNNIITSKDAVYNNCSIYTV